MSGESSRSNHAAVRFPPPLAAVLTMLVGYYWLETVLPLGEPAYPTIRP